MTRPTRTCSNTRSALVTDPIRYAHAMGLVDGEKLYVKAGDESHKALHVESLWCDIKKSQAAVAQSINGLPIFFCALGRIKAASL